MADPIQHEPNHGTTSLSGPHDHDHDNAHSSATHALSPRTSLEAHSGQTSGDSATSLPQSLLSRQFSHDGTAVPESAPRPSQSALRSPFDASHRAKRATRMIDKIGWWPAILLVLSLAQLAVSVVLLSWIWFASREDPRWRNLMLRRYSTMAVTITTFLARIAFAGITWVTSAMMASIVVERHGVPDEKVPEASIARYTGSIISLMLDGFTLKTSWFRVLVPAQAVCTLLSQLSSTLLFSDFRSSLLPGFPSETTVRYEFDVSDIDPPNNTLENPVADFALDWVSAQPQSFEPFAEHSRPEERIVDDDALDDTGPAWRAFLPLDTYENNTNIKEYTGPARVVDSRTICVRPDIQTLTLQGKSAGVNDMPQWTGRIRVNASRVPDMLYTGDYDGIFEENFVCSIVGYLNDPDHWDWVQCKLAKAEHHRVPTLDPLYYNRSAFDAMQAEYTAALGGPALTAAEVRESPMQQIILGRTGKAQMLLGATYGSAGWGIDKAEAVIEQYAGDSRELEFFVSTLPREGPWNNANVSATADGKPFSMPGGVGVLHPIPVRVTYCWDVMTHPFAPVAYLNVTASSGTVLSPPITSWNAPLSRYDTHGIRSQLAATAERLNPQNRAVLSLVRDSFEHAVEHDIKPADVASHVRGFEAEKTYSYPWQSYLINSRRLAFVYDEDSLRPPTHVFWEHLLGDILRDTGSPALAVQAINTAASRMIYAHWTGSYTKEGRANITRLTEFSVPVAVTGYAIVMAVVAMQVALLVVVGLLFRACSNTVLNNAWLAVSQVSSSPEVVGELVRRSAVTDADAERFMKGYQGMGFRRRRLVARDGAFRRFEPD